jgi:hypothetical protein
VPFFLATWGYPFSQANIALDPIIPQHAIEIKIMINNFFIITPLLFYG